MVIVAGGVFMIVMGVFGKVGAIFATIPSPVIGGMFMVMFGVISAAGISTLQVSTLCDERQMMNHTEAKLFTYYMRYCNDM